jgi:hypothetical protein
MATFRSLLARGSPPRAFIVHPLALRCPSSFPRFFDQARKLLLQDGAVDLTPVVSFAVKACDEITNPSASSGARQIKCAFDRRLVRIHGRFGYLAIM